MATMETLRAIKWSKSDDSRKYPCFVLKRLTRGGLSKMGKDFNIGFDTSRNTFIMNFFRPTTRSEILAILDMVISENPNVNESKDILEQRLREGRIGDLAIVEGGPSWWRLMDSPGKNIYS